MAKRSHDNVADIEKNWFAVLPSELMVRLVDEVVSATMNDKDDAVSGPCHLFVSGHRYSPLALVRVLYGQLSHIDKRWLQAVRRTTELRETGRLTDGMMADTLAVKYDPPKKAIIDADIARQFCVLDCPCRQHCPRFVQLWTDLHLFFMLRGHYRWVERVSGATKFSFALAVSRVLLLYQEGHHTKRYLRYRPYPTKASPLGTLCLIIKHRCVLHPDIGGEEDCLIYLPLWALRQHLGEFKDCYRAYKRTCYSALVYQNKRLVPKNYKRRYATEADDRKHERQCTPSRSFQWLGDAESQKQFLTQHWATIVEDMMNPARVYRLSGGVDKDDEIFKGLDVYQPLIERDSALMYNLIEGWRDSLCAVEETGLGPLIEKERERKRGCIHCSDFRYLL
jgi:hypothetical protein